MSDLLSNSERLTQSACGLLAEKLQSQGLKLATAESCTGGLIAAACTALSGSSNWFERGFVTYSNEAKNELLGVSKDIIETFGAVSIACAWAMAQGALKRSNADVAVAISGIAGPDGGIDRSLGVVALIKPAAGYRHDARLFIRQVDLLFVLDRAAGRGRRTPTGLLAGALLLFGARCQLLLILGLLLLADAADGLGRSDEALRLTGRVAEALGAKAAQKGPAAWARALYAVRLARLREEARRRNDQNLLGQLQTRARSDGLVGYAGKMLVALTWAHPDANLELYLSPPGRGVDKANPDGERATLNGAAVGLMAQRYDRVEPGEWRFTVRKPAGAQGQGRYTAELTILLDEGTDREAVRRTQVTLPANAETETARFVLRDGKLTPEK